VIKTLFIKLYKFRNLLVLKEVSKPIGIRLLNDVVIIKDFTKEEILLDLSEIDGISSLEPTTSEVPRSLRPLELPALGPFKPSKPENRPSEPIFKLFKKPIKPVDSSDPDEI